MDHLSDLLQSVCPDSEIDDDIKLTVIFLASLKFLELMQKHFENLKAHFENYNVPFENIIGYAADGASIMMG